MIGGHRGPRAVPSRQQSIGRAMGTSAMALGANADVSCQPDYVEGEVPMTPGEVVQTYADAWVAGDAATIVGLYADDIVLHYFGQNPLAGDHAGKPAALAALARISALTKRGTPEVHDVIASDSHAAILATERWMDGDTPVAVNRLLLYHVRDGKLSECWIYDEDQRLVDAILSKG